MGAGRRDLICGSLFAVIGLVFAIGAWRSLPIGSAVAMGPGYFPLVLGLVLVALGFVVALGRGGAEALTFPPVAWRGLALIVGAVLVFALTVRGLGMAPSLLVATFMAALATGRMTLVGAVVLSVILTAFNVGVFVYALRLPYPVVGPWLGA